MNQNSSNAITDIISDKTIRSLLSTQGFSVLNNIFSSELCLQLSNDIKNLTNNGEILPDSDRNLITNGLLKVSEKAFDLLDDAALGLLVSQAFYKDSILNLMEGVRISVNEDCWRSNFIKPLNCLQARSFRPGINIYFPLDDGDCNLEIIPSTQYNEVNTLSDSMKIKSLSVPQGSALVLEGRIKYRFKSSANTLLKMNFIRPWMKPDILFTTALGKAKIERLGLLGQQWCGFHIGLPVTIEEFLLIESAALESEHGRVKGSGV